MDYLHLHIQFPSGTSETHYTNVNPIDRSKQNPILETCFYEVELPGIEIKESAVIIISESDAQCDSNVKEYLISINHRENDSALSVKAKKLQLKGVRLLESQQLDGTNCCKLKNGSTSWEKSSNN